MVQLETVYRELPGTAVLECMEPYLRAEVRCSPMGGVEVIVEATPDHMTQSHRFHFGLDQSYLPHVVSGCARILKRFSRQGTEAVATPSDAPPRRR